MAEYMDKEAFKKSVEERYCKPCKAEKKDHNGCWCRACWVDDMLDEVECFQPADVAPVVHGRWEYIPPEESVDAAPVVRCKDCKYRDGTPGQPNILCAQMHEDDFCSYGECREGKDG